VKERRGMDERCRKSAVTGLHRPPGRSTLKLIDQPAMRRQRSPGWVRAENVQERLPVRDYKLTPRFGDLTFLRTAASITLDALGLSAIARHVEQAGVIQASIAWARRPCCAVASGRLGMNRLSPVSVPFSRIASASQSESGRLSRDFAPRISFSV